eukprot:TRINITY_DN75919_c0_g1_i1.p1 TRINITY_DN75919_c0_g1~~TRINITY_DN75919_c0_g1_i1.p1  ORF type:complete len:1066 (-),score=210.16 TRINITY_DN75919_c0_g1_i1:63-3260(-)
MPGAPRRCWYATVIFFCLYTRVQGMRDQDHEDASQASDLEVDSDASGLLASGLGVLLGNVETFLSSPEIQEQRREASTLSLTQDIAKLGLPIDRRFKIFLLRSVLEGGLREVHAQAGSFLQSAHAESARVDTEETEGRLNGILSNETPALDSRAGRGPWNKLQILTKVKAGNSKACDKAYMDSIIQTADLQVQDDLIEEIYKALQNYCQLKSLVEAEKRAPVVKGLEVLQSLDLMSDQDASLSGMSVATVKDKQAFFRARALKHSAWLHKVKNPSKYGSVRAVFFKALVTQGRLEKMLKRLTDAASINWLRVRSASMGKVVAETVLWAVKYTGKYLVKIAKNAAAFFKNAWGSFLDSLRKSQEQCTEEAEGMAESSAKKTGLPDVEAEGNEAIAERLSTMSAAAMEEEANKVERSLEAMKRTSEQGMVDEADLTDKMQKTISDAEDIQKELLDPTGPKNIDAALGDLDKLDDDVKHVEKGLCKRHITFSVQGLQDGFRKAMQAIKAAAGVPAPQLGIRGLGVGVSLLGGGIEEVIDFRNREIAQFRWSSVSIGSTTATKIGVSAYAGIGWKGYKENWTLETAYQTGIWSAGSASMGLLGIPASIGVTIGTDADNSQGPWVPEPHGINSVLFGAGVGADLTDLILPLKYDYGLSYYWLTNTECYPDYWSLLKYIWAPSCDRCAFLLAAKITGLRSAIRASFPIISEMIFSVLAGMYEFLHPDRKTVCSTASLNYRDNVTLLAERAAKLMFESVKLDEQVQLQADVLHSKLSIADILNPEFQESYEWKQLRKSLGAVSETCSKFPPELALGDDKELQEKTDEELKKMCTELKLHTKCKTSKSKYKRVSRISLYIALRDNIFQEHTAVTLREKVNAIRRERYEDESLNRASLYLETAASCECRKATDVVRSLQTIGTKRLKLICDTLGVNCVQRDQQSASMKGCSLFKSSCSWWDEEMMALKIVDHIMRTQMPSNEKYPFGLCSVDAECTWVDGTICQPIKDSQDGSSRCGCESNTCYDIDVKTGKPFCKSDVRDVGQVYDSFRREYLKDKIVLGQMMSRLETLSGDG